MAKSDVLVRMKADTQNYDANIAKARKQLDQFKKDNLSLGGALKQTTTALTGLAAQFVGVYAAINGAKKVMSDMININKQFEQGTANLASIMGQSREEIAKLTTQAKQLGATTRYTAMQITELQTNLARLGFTQQEILNSTTAVQALATATGADLGEAANLAGAALRGFGMNASEMERVASVLSVSTTKSALSFEKLATAIPIVAPVAKQFGFTIEDTVTMLAKLSDAGMDASSAATATRNIFLKMANDSGKLAQALGRPVHSVEEFGAALAEMRQKGMSLSDILSMVGVRSTAAFAVFADNAETLKDFKASITDCGDAMHDMEKKQLDTLQGSIYLLNSAWEGLMLSFNNSNGTIKSVTDTLSDLLTAWTRWRNRNQGGDAAIQTYELSDDDIKKKADARLQSLREGINGRTGKRWYESDEEITTKITADNEALEKRIDTLEKLKELYAEYEKFAKNFDYNNPQHVAKNDQYLAQFRAAGYGGGDESRTQFYKDIAALYDQKRINDYIISALSPSQATTAADAQAQADANIKLLKAQYEEQEKAQIAALDRMSMNEADYEAAVYRIKREALQKIADLYQEETAEKARANAALLDLDIRYQATQMRLANRASRGNKETEVYMAGPERSPFERMQMSILAQQADQAAAIDENSLKTLMGVALQNGINGLDLDFSHILDEMREGLYIPAETWKELEDKINAQLAALNIDPIHLNVETGNLEAPVKTAKDTAAAWQAASAAISPVGAALQQIDDPAAKIAGILATAVANIALGFANATASPATGAAGIFGWIAATTAGLATMISTITAIKSVTSAGNFAEGGVVGGNSYSGDRLIAHVNSGETILTAAQTDRLASMITANPFGNLQLTTKVQGTDLLVILNNANRSMGGSRSFYTERH